MKKSVLIALVISVVAVLWILSGVMGEKKNAPSSETDTNSVNKTEPSPLQETKIPEVRVRDLTAQMMDDEVEVTGRTQASRQVIIRGETEGQIGSLLVKKGDIVREGQILAKIEVRDRAAILEEAKQLLKQRQIQYNASKELAEKGYNSRVRLAEKEAELQSARAQIKQAEEELSRTVIKAPFGGIINNQMIEIGDYISKGNEMFEIVDLSPIEIAGFLTEKQVSGIKEGDVASAVLLNSQVVEGKVTFIAPAADIQTRTFEMELTVANEDNAIKEGLTAKIMIPFNEDKAYKISPSILSLGDDGVIGVKIVDANNIVRFKSVRLLKDTPEFLWINGLPDAVRIITVGQEFVIEGQEVKPVLSEDKELL